MHTVAIGNDTIGNIERGNEVFQLHINIKPYRESATQDCRHPRSQTVVSVTSLSPSRMARFSPLSGFRWTSPAAVAPPYAGLFVSVYLNDRFWPVAVFVKVVVA